MDLRQGDFREVLADIPDGSVDLILSDPPYPKEYMHLFPDFLSISYRLLKADRFCIFYISSYNLDTIFQMISESNLSYYQMAICRHNGSCSVLNHYKMMGAWKPVLILRKGKGVSTDWWTNQLPEGGKDKRFHKWGQSLPESIYLIEKFSLPGERICDPFLGGGTCAIAALETGRNFLGCEIDPASFAICQKRIQEHTILCPVIQTTLEEEGT